MSAAVKGSRARVWFLAARPKTLPAAVVPVVVGTAVAWDLGGFRAGPAAAALLGALLIQVGTNFANDYLDFVHGADSADRIGPTRAVASGLVTPGRMKAATALAFAAAGLSGLYLAWVAGWPVVAIGAAAIAAGVGYTAGGRRSLGYLGLGDLAVFLFFGPVAVAGTAYVQLLRFPPEAFVAAVPVGCLAVAILVVNNARDADTDRASGKRTLAVRLGRGFARAEYLALLAVAYGVPLLQALPPDLADQEGVRPAREVAGTSQEGVGPGREVAGSSEEGVGPGREVAGSSEDVADWSREGPSVLLAWLSLPLAWPPLRKLLAPFDGPALNAALAETARLLLAFGALYALGIVL